MEAAPHPWPALGVLLMRDGIVSKEDLEAILSEQHDTRLQRISGRRLGEILIERGMATPDQIARLIAEQYELPFVDFDVSDIDLRVARVLSPDDARRLSALPLSKRADDSFLLAIADPSTVVFSDELRRLLGATPHFAVVGPAALEEAITYVEERAVEPPAAAGELAPASSEGLLVELRPETTGEPPLSYRKSDTHHWPPLGALLIREGLLSDADLETALAQQRLSASRRLGEILVERGIVSRTEIARLLAEQYELSFVDLSKTEVDPAVARLLPEEIARAHPAVPIARHADGSLEVAIADPTNLFATDDLHRALEVPLSFAVASPDAINALIEATHSSEAPSARLEAGATTVEPELEAEPAVIALDDAFVPDPVPEESVPEETGVGETNTDAMIPFQPAGEDFSEVVDEQFTAHDEPVTRPQAFDDGAEEVAAPPEPTWSRALDLDDADQDQVSETDEREDSDESEPDLATTLLAEVTDTEDVAAPSEPPVGLVPVFPTAELEHFGESEALELADDSQPSADDSQPLSFAESGAPFTRWLPVDEPEQVSASEQVDAFDRSAEPERTEAVEAPGASTQPEDVEEPEDVPQAHDVAHLEDVAEPEDVTEPEDVAEPEEVAQPEDVPQAHDVAHLEDVAEPEDVGEPEDVAQPEETGWLEEVEWLEDTTGLREPELEVVAEQAESIEEPAVPASAEHEPPNGDLAAALEDILAAGAAVIHFSPQADGVHVRARVDGLLRELGSVSHAECEGLVSGLESSAHVRVHVMPTKRGHKVTVFAREPESVPTSFAELGLAEDARTTLQAALDGRSGIVLTCGPVGSGTTATLYAAVDALTADDRVVTTIEDPVERLLDGVDQVEVDEAEGITFASGLRSLRHSDSDVFVVGELADRETADVAFRFALSGRLVLSALRAPSAAGALHRLADMGLDGAIVGDVLTCVVAQRLVRRVCADCRETYYASESELAELELPLEGAGPRLLARGRGCDRCGGTGFRGRTAIFEVLEMTDDIRDLVREGASAKKIHRAAVAAGMRTLREDGIRLCLEGVTTASEVTRVLGPRH